MFIAIWQHDLINELLYVSASLIGLDTVKSGLTMLKSTKKITLLYDHPIQRN